MPVKGNRVQYENFKRIYSGFPAFVMPEIRLYWPIYVSLLPDCEFKS